MFNHPDILPSVNYRPSRGVEFFLSESVARTEWSSFFVAGLAWQKIAGMEDRKAAQIPLFKIQKPEIALRFICFYIVIKNYSCVGLSLSFEKKNLMIIGKVVTRTIISTMISSFFFKSIPNWSINNLSK